MLRGCARCERDANGAGSDNIRDNKQIYLTMIVKLIIPIETLRGKLREDGYYFRLYKEKQIVQRNPTKWKDTPARKAARERFIERYAKKKTAAHE